jgi:hypothetical protein
MYAGADSQVKRVLVPGVLEHQISKASAGPRELPWPAVAAPAAVLRQMGKIHGRAARKRGAKAPDERHLADLEGSLGRPATADEEGAFRKGFEEGDGA